MLFGELRVALGYGAAENSKKPVPVDPDGCRYSRILWLFDPDADGIHGGALMLIYFYQQFPALLSVGHISVVRPPLFELIYSETAHPDAPCKSQLAYTEEQFQQLQRELTLVGAVRLKTRRLRGLGGMPSDLLRATCIDPSTRAAFRLSRSEHNPLSPSSAARDRDRFLRRSTGNYRWTWDEYRLNEALSFLASISRNRAVLVTSLLVRSRRADN